MFFVFILGIEKCPGVCEYFPCGCCEDNILVNCNACHANGCDECNSDENLFKRDYTYYCETCQDIFGDACLFCSDFTGCQLCDGLHDHVQDSITEMYYCQPKSGTATVLDCGVNHKIEYNVTAFPDHNPDPSCISARTLTPTEPTRMYIFVISDMCFLLLIIFVCLFVFCLLK